MGSSSLLPLRGDLGGVSIATDLDDVWYYVAKESGSIAVANHLIDSITDRFFLLAGHPYLGRPRDDDFGVTWPGTLSELFADGLAGN